MMALLPTNIFDCKSFLSPIFYLKNLKQKIVALRADNNTLNKNIQILLAKLEGVQGFGDKLEEFFASNGSIRELRNLTTSITTLGFVGETEIASFPEEKRAVSKIIQPPEPKYIPNFLFEPYGFYGDSNSSSSSSSSSSTSSSCSRFYSLFSTPSICSIGSSSSSSSSFNPSSS